MKNLDELRNRNRESLRVMSETKQSSKKVYLCSSPHIFISVPLEIAIKTIQEDQLRIDEEIESLRKNIKMKSEELYELEKEEQSDKNPVSSFFLNPIN